MAVSRPRRVDISTPSKNADRFNAFDRSPVGSYTRERTTDADEAEEIISKHYLPNRLFLPRSTSLEMDLAGLQIGVITTGRLSYGQRVRLLTEEAHNFHVNGQVPGSGVTADPSGLGSEGWFSGVGWGGLAS